MPSLSAFELSTVWGSSSVVIGCGEPRTCGRFLIYGSAAVSSGGVVVSPFCAWGVRGYGSVKIF